MFNSFTKPSSLIAKPGWIKNNYRIFYNFIEVSIDYLESPYDTHCMKYENIGFESQEDCRNECLTAMIDNYCYIDEKLTGDVETYISH